jgi:hypothetical protein
MIVTCARGSGGECRICYYTRRGSFKDIEDAKKVMKLDDLERLKLGNIDLAEKYATLFFKSPTFVFQITSAIISSSSKTYNITIITIDLTQVRRLACQGCDSTGFAPRITTAARVGGQQTLHAQD